MLRATACFWGATAALLSLDWWCSKQQYPKVVFYLLQVVGGIDMDVDAISSYTANTMTNSHGAFNKSGLEPLPLHMPVCPQAVQLLRCLITLL